MSPQSNGKTKGNGMHSYRTCFAKGLRVHLAHADVRALAAVDESFHCAHRVLEWHGTVKTPRLPVVELLDGPEVLLDVRDTGAFRRVKEYTMSLCTDIEAREARQSYL